MPGWGADWKGQHSSTLQINASFVSSLLCFVWGTHVTSSITQPFNSPRGGEESSLPGAINSPDGHVWTGALSLQHPSAFTFTSSFCVLLRLAASVFLKACQSVCQYPSAWTYQVFSDFGVEKKNIRSFNCFSLRAFGLKVVLEGVISHFLRIKKRTVVWLECMSNTVFFLDF